MTTTANTIEVAHKPTMRERYKRFDDFLKQSLIFLDDFFPSYGSFDQFANTGFALIGKPVVAYYPQFIGNGFLNHIKQAGISPNPLYVIRKNGQRPVIETVLNDEKIINDLENIVHDSELKFLLPFMMNDYSERLSDVLGLHDLAKKKIMHKLNDKKFMKTIAIQENVRILGSLSCTNEEEADLLYDEVRKNSENVIFKRTFSYGGEGNYVIRNKNELAAFLKNDFQRGKSYLVEPYISYKHSPCALFFISPEGAINPLAITEQMLVGDSKYVGSRHPATIPGDIKKEMLDSSMKLSRRIQQEGYIGPLGFDFLVTENGTTYFVESNVRVNYSHFMLHVANALNGDDSFCGIVSDIYPKNKFKDLSAVVEAMDKKDLLSAENPVGAFPFYAAGNGNKCIKLVSLILLGDDEEKLISLKEKYEGRF